MSRSAPAASGLGTARPAGFGLIISTLGVGQIFAWGSSYYLPAVLAKPIADDTGWPLTWVVGGLSLGLLAAGLISPWVGRTIALLAVGLGILAVAQTVPAYLAAWLVLGIGMGAGLYDPAFATLGRLYGAAARPAITTLTLFGGLASTVCWPLSAFLVTYLGWRGTCLAYAAFHLIVLLPIYLLALPREPESQAASAVGSGASEAVPAPRIASTRFLVGLLAIAITLSAMISTLLSVHLLAILQSRGIGLAAAVALGALVPSSSPPCWSRSASPPSGHRCRSLPCRSSSTAPGSGWSRSREAPCRSSCSEGQDMPR